MTIGPLTDYSALDEVQGQLRSFDWVVFTSAPGVRHFADRLWATGGDARRFGACRIAAIGTATAAALADYHLHTDLVPEVARSEGLADALRDQVRGKRVLVAQADRGRGVLADELRRVAEVEVVATYHHRDAQPPDGGSGGSAGLVGGYRPGGNDVERHGGDNRARDDSDSSRLTDWIDLRSRRTRIDQREPISRKAKAWQRFGHDQEH